MLSLLCCDAIAMQNDGISNSLLDVMVEQNLLLRILAAKQYFLQRKRVYVVLFYNKVFICNS